MGLPSLRPLHSTSSARHLTNLHPVDAWLVTARDHLLITLATDLKLVGGRYHEIRKSREVSFDEEDQKRPWAPITQVRSPLGQGEWARLSGPHSLRRFADEVQQRGFQLDPNIHALFNDETRVFSLAPGLDRPLALHALGEWLPALLVLHESTPKTLDNLAKLDVLSYLRAIAGKVLHPVAKWGYPTVLDHRGYHDRYPGLS